MKLAVIGSREITDYSMVSGVLNGYAISEIISGGARGVDSLAARYATELGITLTIYEPEWKKYGRGAGIIRNKLIIDEADCVLAFWNGTSPGTKHSIQLARKANKTIDVRKVSK